MSVALYNQQQNNGPKRSPFRGQTRYEKYPRNSRALPCRVCERILPLTFYSSRPRGDSFALPLVAVCLTCEKLSSPRKCNKMFKHHVSPQGTNPSTVGRKYIFGVSKTGFTEMQIQEKPFPCPVCEKSFGSKQKLHLHSTVHTGEKRYECLECGKRFRLSQSLTIHRRVHTGETPYECGVCGKRFKALPSLYSHRKIHTK